LYVFHNFANSMTLHMIMLFRSPPWLMNLYGIPSVRILIFAGLTVGLASYSWHRFEKPINDLKRKFPYPDEKQFPAFSPPQTNIPNPLP
jgi:peptidoglycan/LPS O-acetylase OafA/YrhL